SLCNKGVASCRTSFKLPRPCSAVASERPHSNGDSIGVLIRRAVKFQRPLRATTLAFGRGGIPSTPPSPAGKGGRAEGRQRCARAENPRGLGRASTPVAATSAWAEFGAAQPGHLRQARDVQHHRNAGWPTGRESQGHGVPIVVRGRESRSPGEGG